MLQLSPKMAAMPLRNPFVVESFHPLSDNLSNFTRIFRSPQILVPKRLPRFQVPFVGFRAPVKGIFCRDRGFVSSRFDFGILQAVSDVGSGGDGGFRDPGDGGDGGGSGDENGGNNWSFLSWYLAALDNHPVMTKALTSAFLTLIGDLICQILIDQVPKLDAKRTAVFTFLGFVLVGPTLHFWFLSLSKLITMPGVSGASLRLLLDQLFFSPIFIGVFLSALLTLEGRPSQVVPKLQQEWFSSVLANWQLWIPFQFLNFQFVPQKFQVLAANFVALVWNVILSFRAHKEVLMK